MKLRIISFIIVTIILFASFSTASVLKDISMSVNLNSRQSSNLNMTIFKFPFAKVIVPVPSGLYQINWGFNKGFGFGTDKFGFGIGYLVFVKAMVTYGNITIKPLNQESIILQPGDNITVLFGTYHALVWSSDGEYCNNGGMVGRFFGVKIEKFQ
jgi:hypothetical protein